MFKEYWSEIRIINYLNYALDRMYDINNLKLTNQIIDDKIRFIISYDIYQNGKSITLYREITKARFIKLVKMGYKLITKKEVTDINIYNSPKGIKYQAIYYINDRLSRRRKK